MIERLAAAVLGLIVAFPILYFVFHPANGGVYVARIC